MTTTTWTEPRAFKNKTQKWVFATLQEILGSFPFDTLGLDSDNGSGVINDQLLRFCEQENLHAVTADNKNDGCHVEEKNWSVVRQVVGPTAIPGRQLKAQYIGASMTYLPREDQLLLPRGDVERQATG